MCIRDRECINYPRSDNPIVTHAQVNPGQKLQEVELLTQQPSKKFDKEQRLKVKVWCPVQYPYLAEEFRTENKWGRDIGHLHTTCLGKNNWSALKLCKRCTSDTYCQEREGDVNATCNIRHGKCVVWGKRAYFMFLKISKMHLHWIG